VRVFLCENDAAAANRASGSDGASHASNRFAAIEKEEAGKY
jgi:hypothetical protein